MAGHEKIVRLKIPGATRGRSRLKTLSAFACAVVCLATLLLMTVPASGEARRRPSFFITPTWGLLSSPAGWRRHPILNVSRHHSGIDISAAAGTPVLASAHGRVWFTGSYAGYGNVIVIDHGQGWATLYAHLGSITVPRTQVVRQGQMVGTVGSTGISTGPHLHFEIRYRQRALDPLRYLNR